MKLPHRFGKYVLLKKIANGGMAEIYRAKYLGERGFAKDLAIKRILPRWSDRKDFETMLIDEAKALVHLQHQNIVQVFELGVDGDYYFISMEYVDGVDLKKLYKCLEKEGSGLSEKYACFIISEVLKALEFAHRQSDDDGKQLSIVHRDISPQNILLSMSGEVKLTDFGIARGCHRDHETTTQQLKGKYAYMSPEQARGEPVDQRSDLYSTAIVLFEILTGSRMFDAASDYETIKSVSESRLQLDWETRVSLGMRRMLKRALSRSTEERYQSAAEFLKELNEYVSMKHLHTYALEFSEFLTKIFPDHKEEKIKFQEKKKRETKILKMKERNFINVGKRYAALIILFLPLLLAATLKSASGGDGFFVKQMDELGGSVTSKQGDPGAQKVSIGPEMPKLEKGLLNIDSVPPGASVTLAYGNTTKRFTTPFIEAGVDIDDGFEAQMTIEKKGYKSVTEKISMTADNPILSRSYELSSDAPARVSIQARPWGYVSIPGTLNRRESPVSGVQLSPGRHEVKVFYSPTNSWARADIDAIAGGTYTCVADFTRGNKMWCK